MPLINWDTLTTSINRGGLEIWDLEDMIRLWLLSGFTSTLIIEKSCGEMWFVPVTREPIVLCRPWEIMTKTRC